MTAEIATPARATRRASRRRRVQYLITADEHSLAELEATLATLHKALKPGGELVLIDFKRIPGESSDFILGHVRAGQDVFEAEVVAAGFEKVDEIKDVLKENYFVKFRRK